MPNITSEPYVFLVDAEREGAFDGLLDQVTFDPATGTVTLAYNLGQNVFGAKIPLHTTRIDDPALLRHEIVDQAFDADGNGKADQRDISGNWIENAAIADFKPTYHFMSRSDKLSNSIPLGFSELFTSVELYRGDHAYTKGYEDETDLDRSITYPVPGGLDEIFERLDAHGDGQEDFVRIFTDGAYTISVYTHINPTTQPNQ